MIRGIIDINRRRYPEDPDEAADFWLSRRVLGLMSAHDEAAFQAWLESPANAEAFARSQAAYDQMSPHAAHPEIVAMRAGLLRAGRPRRSPVVWWAVPAAAAALVVVASGVFLANDPGPGAAALNPAAGGPQHYETAVGKHRSVRLDDGSTVDLNTNSIIEVAFNRESRTVRLVRGEALFKVAHNKAWPFVVAAGDREVTAVGTAFDVRLDPDTVKVVMVEGKVRVAPLKRRGLAVIIPALASESIVAGEELSANPGKPDVEVSTADVQKSTSWRSGEVIFRDDTLQTAVDEFNRYTEGKIVIADPKVSALKVSGVFHTDRPTNFLAAVTAFYPLSTRKRSEDVTELEWRTEK
ncbi:FecR family protein [Asticcacaulis solisilvae]|uniref:FecR family protein n=1 Tax=Asticcacaulis solisilvae TaxID=1217274 RepID=UPI003FD71E45